MSDVGSAGHLIAVSTAYVASTHQGEAKEELLSENRYTLDVSWRDEVTAARRLRDDLQAESRKPERLKEFTKRARSEIGAAGDHLIAARSEKVREEWVSGELVTAGTARALSLGWPDAYPFTKALGERALVEQWEGTVPISFVRPSIIESAVSEPRPGWIRGFRMAEPIIISYARGLLAEFPGVPEGIIDVIPVDLVVAAILAVAARGPEPGRPTVYHVASGVRNPLRYGRLVELSTGFFQRHPLYDERGQPISVPEWSFPGRGRVQRQLKRADAAMAFAEKLLTALPIRGKQAQLAARIEDRHAMAKRALGYVELYGAYTETDARYRVDNLLELWSGCDADDHATFGFDPGVIDWDRYVLEIHLPSVLEHTRVRTTPGKSVVDKRPERQRKAILSPERHLAVFDLEHTLMSSNVVDTYAWLASRHLSPARRARFVADLVRQGPGLLALDRRDRGDFLSAFYRRFEDAPVAQLREDSWELFHRQLLTRSFPEGFARVRAHRALGHRTLLITGALDFVIDPIRPLFDDIVCAVMGVRDGRLTGQLTTLPPIGEARAIVLSEYADEHALSLEQSVAYADSASDLAMLEAVGFPVAVNPEARLATIARRRGWHVEHWAKAEGGSHRPLPLGPFDVRSPKAVMGR
jgi:fatty acyl-CoA reductase